MAYVHLICFLFYRLFIINKGYINYIPVIIMWLLFLCSSNFSFPSFPFY